ncbi:50S ribosomal protein L19 [Patescibacteria group bacterium]|nr:50S ribosomal protein L19 [Patescibacteria group bacterium]
MTNIIQDQLKKVPEIKAGQTVKVYQRVKEGNKERVQPFEGLVLAVKHGQGLDGTFTVRKIASGVGVEKIYPLHSPTIDKIEVLKKANVRRAKLYYMRARSGKSARMKSENIIVPSEGEAENETTET